MNNNSVLSVHRVNIGIKVVRNFPNSKVKTLNLGYVDSTSYQNNVL